MCKEVVLGLSSSVFIYCHSGGGTTEFVWVNLDSGIEIHFTLFLAFSEKYALAFVEIQILAVHSDEFSDSHSGRGKLANVCKVADHHDRRAKSLFKYGLEYISQCSVNVWVIPRKLLNLQMIDNEWQKVVESGSDRMGGGI